MIDRKDIEKWTVEHEAEMISDIRTLVRIPSVSGEADRKGPFGTVCSEVLEQFFRMGRGYGFQTSECEGYAGEVTYGCGTREIGLFAHLDVVAEGDGWEYPAFDVTRIGDYLIGRGVMDNKGAVVAALYAFRYIKENGLLPKDFKCRLITGLNEEKGMEDIRYFLKHRACPQISIVVDSPFPVCRGEKGLLRMELTKDMSSSGLIINAGKAVNVVPGSAEARFGSRTVHAVGTEGHSAFPENSKNAIELLCRMIKENDEFLSLLNEDEVRLIDFLQDTASDGKGTGLGINTTDPDMGDLTCNLGLVRVTDGEMRINLDIRTPASADADKITDRIRQKAEAAGFRIVTQTYKPSYCYGTDDPLVRTLSDTYEQVTGDKDTTFINSAGTYASLIPGAVAFGPVFDDDFKELGFSDGRGRLHSADEAQSISKLEKAIEIYILSIVNIIDKYDSIILERNSMI